MAQERIRRSERNNQSRYKSESSQEERTMVPETRNGKVVGAALLNFRSSPERWNPNNIIDTLRQGEEVTILETVGDMLKVRIITGREGYVASKFIEEV